MREQERLADQFEAYRRHLLAVAYRMLGSLSEAEDAVQEAWLRLSRSETDGIENLGGWLTAVVSRICLDMLRSRKRKYAESIDDAAWSETLQAADHRSEPEQEAIVADRVGVALLVVLGRLNPAERVAFVLHDIFAVPFAEIAPIVGKSATAARQLASRARRRVQGERVEPAADAVRQRELLEAFLAAAYAGDFNALVAVLDPDVVLRDDRAGAPGVMRGAAALAGQVSGRAQAAQVALVDGAFGVIAAPRGKLLYVLKFTIREGKIAEVELISDMARLRRINLAIPGGLCRAGDSNRLAAATTRLADNIYIRSESNGACFIY